MLFSKANFYSVALLLVGALSLSVPSGYSYGFWLIVFSGVVFWFVARGPLIDVHSKYFLMPLCAYGVGQAVMALHEKWAVREFGNYFPFVLVVFGVWAIRKYKPKAAWFWLGLAIGAMGAAVLSAYQAQVLGLRAGGHTHPIQFGNIALLLGVLCMVRALVVFRISWLNVSLWCGFIAGLCASLWSQTRGGWVAVALIFFWILARSTKGWTFQRRWTVALALFALAAMPVLQQTGRVQSRIVEAVNEIRDFYESGKQDTSVGSRLALWRVGIEGIKKAPIFGQGNSGWVRARDEAIEAGQLSSFVSEFTQLHNEYLNITFKRGLVGLALYLLLCMVPMLFFFRPYSQHSNVELRALAIAGMVVPMMYMDFGLTQSFLTHNSGRIVLCSLWMCIAGLMLNVVEKGSG